MSNDKARPSSIEEPLDAAFVEFLEAEEAGRSPAIGEFAADYPELVHDLGVHQQLARLAAPLRLLMSTLSLSGDGNEPSLPAGTVIGEYEVLGELGRGGMGVVYKARNQKFNMIVALKMISAGRHATDEQRRRFLQEVEHQARMNHSHIVPVTGGGEFADRLYFTMKLIERADGPTSLDQHLDRFRGDPRAAVRLMVKIARAVHHAHQRGILHRDLKPSNVLLDGEDIPHVSDFGLAKRVGIGDESDETAGLFSPTSIAYRSMVGTAPYMSPEQSDTGADTEVTTLSDVYGLGAILYTLLTGRPPIYAQTVEEVLRLARDPARKPDPIRSQNPDVDRTLERICLKCLEKEPNRRYRSAEGIAKDLECWLHHERTVVPQTFGLRCRNWCQRNPGATALFAAVALLLILSTMMTNIAVAKLQDGLSASAMKSNALGAKRIADHFRWLLRNESWLVLDAAQQESVQDLLKRGKSFKTKNDVREFLNSPEGRDAEHALRLLFNSYNHQLAGDGIPPFATMFFLNADGRLIYHLASHKGDSAINGDLFENRDYFHVAKARAGKQDLEAIHISRVFYSKYDRLYKFAISVPVLDEDANFLGAIEASIPMDDKMGLQKGSLYSETQKVTIVGRVDRNPPTLKVKSASPYEQLDYDYHVLLHEILSRQRMSHLRHEKIDHPGSWPPPPTNRPELDPSDDTSLEPTDNYRDPLENHDPETYGGDWIAGFARVGNSDLIVVVQQRHEHAIGLPAANGTNFLLWGWSMLVLAILLVSTVFWFQRRSGSADNERVVSAVGFF